MSDSRPPVHSLASLTAPPALLARVSRTGSLLLRERRPPPHKRRARKLVVDFSLAGFCFVHLVWCAHIVGLIP